MASNRQANNMKIGVYHNCAVLLREQDPTRAINYEIDRWYEGLTVDVQEKFAFINFQDKSYRRILRKTNKSTQIYPERTRLEALQERRNNNLFREGLRSSTIAAIQAEYAQNPLQ